MEKLEAAWDLLEEKLTKVLGKSPTQNQIDALTEFCQGCNNPCCACDLGVTETYLGCEISQLEPEVSNYISAGSTFASDSKDEEV